MRYLTIKDLSKFIISNFVIIVPVADLFVHFMFICLYYEKHLPIYLLTSQNYLQKPLSLFNNLPSQEGTYHIAAMFFPLLLKAIGGESWSKK